MTVMIKDDSIEVAGHADNRYVCTIVSILTENFGFTQRPDIHAAYLTHRPEQLVKIFIDLYHAFRPLNRPPFKLNILGKDTTALVAAHITYRRENGDPAYEEVTQ